MKILHRYLAKEVFRTLVLCSLGLTTLFLIFDFFDRIDIIMREDPSVFTVLSYFFFKIPPLFNITLPVAMLVAVLFSIGVLSKNSELTAMRAGGLRVFYLARPLFVIAFLLSLLSISVNEFLVPYSMRRVRELYNIDIRGKDKSGEYSQQNLWWRSGKSFFTASTFDSRDNSLHNLLQLELNSHFEVIKRTESVITHWVNPLFGWSMHGVAQLRFKHNQLLERTDLTAQPLPIKETPADFYDSETDPQTMSFFQLKKFIQKQEENGLPAKKYYADLYAKLSYPFVIFICTFVVLPFAIRPARSGSMAFSFLLGLMTGFLYYVVHSFSLAMGRAEFWHPMMAAWTANILMGLVGIILITGVESPE